MAATRFIAEFMAERGSYGSAGRDGGREEVPRVVLAAGSEEG